MKTTRKALPQQMAGIRQSVEVQHGVKGVGLMFRRGLHGAKNWVLEPGEDGIPRTPWEKFGRIVVVLVPVWIVLSAVTGGPERGGREVSALQMLFFALLVTLFGLGFFSARERRLGREEPWADLPELNTDGDDLVAETKVMLSPEETPGDQEKMQVSDVSAESGVDTLSDIPDESDQTSHFSPESATEVATAIPGQPPAERVGGHPFAQVTPHDGEAFQGAARVETSLVGEAETEVINRYIPDPDDLDSPTISLTLPKGGGNPATISLEKAEKDQLSTGGQVETGTIGHHFEWPAAPVTDGDATSDVPHFPGSVTPVATHPVQEPLFSQVVEADEVATPLATPQAPAQPGPYEVTDKPLADDWFLTSPDSAEEGDAPPEQAESSIEEEAESKPVEAAVSEPEAAHDVPANLHPSVVLYRALRGMPGIPEEQMEEARLQAVEWARREIAANRQSKRSAGRILGVTHTTISNWLGTDPWADAESD